MVLFCFFNGTKHKIASPISSVPSGNSDLLSNKDAITSLGGVLKAVPRKKSLIGSTVASSDATEGENDYSKDAKDANSSPLTNQKSVSSAAKRDDTDTRHYIGMILTHFIS